MSKIVVDNKAIEEIVNIINQNAQDFDDVEQVYVRVGVKGGGCSGFQYILDLTENVQDSDEIFEQNSDTGQKIKVACDPKSLLYLNGTTISFRDVSMAQRGFVFDNPNSTSSCGCGSSFSA